MPNQVLNFLNIFTEHGKIIADYTKSMKRISQLLCYKAVVKFFQCFLYSGLAVFVKWSENREIPDLWARVDRYVCMNAFVE